MIAPFVTALICLPLQVSAYEQEPLELASAWQLAEAHSPALRARDSAVRAARADAAASMGMLFPRGSVTARYARLSYAEPMTLELDLPSGEPLVLGDAIENQWALEAAVDQPLFSGGSSLARVRASRSAVEGSLADYEVARADLRVEVAEAYFAVVIAEAELAAANESRSSVAAHLASVGSRAKAGAATHADVALARSRTADAEFAVVEAESGLGVARTRLAVLLGVAPGEIGPLVHPDLPPAARSDALVPDLVRARASAEAAEAWAAVERGALFPHLAVRFEAQVANPNTRWFPVEAEWRDSWDAAVVLNWDALDAGITLQRWRAARARAAGAEWGTAAAEQQLRLAEAIAVEAFERTEAVRSAAREGLTAAEAAHAAAVARFEAGASPIVEVLDREAELSRAKVRVVRTDAAAAMATIELARVRGAL